MKKLFNFKPEVAILIIACTVIFIAIGVALKPASASIQGNTATTEADCRWCHGSDTADRHHFLVPNKDDYTGISYGCLDCHPIKFDPVSNSYYTQLTRDCIVCHGSDVAATGDRHHRLVPYIDGYTGISYQCLDCHQTVYDPTTGMYSVELKQVSIAGTPTSAPVSNHPPVASAGPDQTVVLGQTANFSAAGSYDPDGSITNYSCDFGDGSTGTGLTPSHLYSTPGAYTATLSVTDDKGATTSDTAVINIIESITVPKHVAANEALFITGLKKDTDPDDAGIAQDITLSLTNASDQFQVSNTLGGYQVVTMRTNFESALLSKAIIKLQVKSLSGKSAQTIKIYPYLSDMKSINSNYYVTQKISALGSTDIDVTPLINQMRGYGWMKFKMVCTTKGLTIANGNFVLR